MSHLLCKSTVKGQFFFLLYVQLAGVGPNRDVFLLSIFVNNNPEIHREGVLWKEMYFVRIQLFGNLDVTVFKVYQRQNQSSPLTQLHTHCSCKRSRSCTVPFWGVSETNSSSFLHTHIKAGCRLWEIRTRVQLLARVQTLFVFRTFCCSLTNSGLGLTTNTTRTKS